MLLRRSESEKVIRERLRFSQLNPKDERGEPLPYSGATVTTGNVTSSAYDYEKIGIDDVFGGIGGRERVIAIQRKNRNCKSEPEPLPLQQYPH